MAIVPAFIWWPGWKIDVLRLFADDSEQAEYDAELVDERGRIAVFRALGQDGRPTDRVVGIEVVDFLRFDRWEDVPKLPMQWQLRGQQPLPLVELLKRLQQELRQQTSPTAATA